MWSNGHRRTLAGMAVGGALSVAVLGCRPQGAPPEPPVPKVTVAHPVSRELIDYDYYNGWLQASESVEVRARVNGYLTEIYFRDGEEVEQGAKLFEIDPRPFRAEVDRAQAERARAEAELARTTANLARADKLQPSRAISQEEYDRTVAEKAVADAEVKSAQAALERAELDLEFTQVTAPIAGRISRNLITVGNLVQADTTLLTSVVSISPYFCYFYVDERSLQGYQRRNRERIPDSPRLALSELKIPFEFGLETEEGYPHQGMLDFSDNRVDPATGTIQIRGVIDNQKRLFVSGERVRMRCGNRDPYQALLVPETAILADQDKRYVLALTSDHVVRRQDVRLGRLQDDGMRAVVPLGQEAESLGDQAWIVVQGLQAARINYPVEALDAAGKPIAPPGKPKASATASTPLPVRS